MRLLGLSRPTARLICGVPCRSEVTGFSSYTLKGGNWALPAPSRDQRLEVLEWENDFLRAQVDAQYGQLDFYEDCIAKMVAVVYA